MVLMNTQDYVGKFDDILNDAGGYELLEGNNDNRVMKKILKLTNDYRQELTEQEARYIAHFDHRTSHFYGLPKIHKSTQIMKAISEQQNEIVITTCPTVLKLRPIIAGPACPTHR